jgi:hypothetical protein
LPRFRLGNVPLGQAPHDDVLFSKRRAADDDRVAGAHETMRPRAFAVDVDFAALTGFLRFRSRAKQARYVEPDIEADCFD